MLPVIALVGRPNVGKSTLFNRLTRTRDALVADFPGLTRDRKYGQADYDGYEFIVVDTGGIDGSEQGIETEMAEQSLLAIEEADIVLFLVDARAGMTAADQAIANHLRKQQKKCFVVANKVDGIDADSYCAEFYQLSLGDVHHIAAAHGRGITQLLETTLQPVIAELAGEAEELEESDDELIDLYSEDEEGEDNQQAFADKPVKLAIIG
ncbi:MAG: GTPase, partial [Pseudomonadota bacterium]